MAVLQGLADAETVRDAILARIRHLRSGGLGDEKSGSPAVPDAPRILSPAHLTVLREIRDAVLRIEA